MKRLQLKRISRSSQVTLGIILDVNTGLPITLSLELPWVSNERRISCIPSGIYLVKPHTSQQFPGCYEIMNVPQRDHILIHPGNTTDDILGCICPGAYYGTLKGKPAVLRSKDAMDKLREYVGGQGFELDVVGRS